jgi:hypothetical protein
MNLTNVVMSVSLTVFVGMHIIVPFQLNKC